MAIYAIGDVQGCFEELLALYSTLCIDTRADELVLVGDIVNRGPASLAVLRWVYQHRDHVKVVLGNHDLHLLAVHAGHAKLKSGDTLEQVLEAPDAPLLMSWLRAQPLVLLRDSHLFVHAGLLPAWSDSLAAELSSRFGAVLNSDDGDRFLARMYGNEPRLWADELEEHDRYRLLVNACTRMRMMDADGGINFRYKGRHDEAPAGMLAWFDYSRPAGRTRRVVCGHWSALGLLVRPDVVALDTGCVWGGALTAIRLDDDQVFQVPSLQPRVDSWE